MEALNENNVVLSMPMFKNNKGYVLDKVIEDLRLYWELDVTDIEGDDELATFKVGDELVAISMMPVPIPNSEFESMYSYSYLWENVENETKENAGHKLQSEDRETGFGQFYGDGICRVSLYERDGGRTKSVGFHRGKGL